MKFSAPDWCFYRDGIDYYARLKSLGIDMAEMVPANRRAAARAAGLQILNLIGPGMQKGINRRESHAELIPKIRDAIAEAKTEKIPHVILFSGNREGQADAIGFDNCRHALEQVLPDAEKAEVTLTFELFNQFDHPDYQADSSAFGIKLAQALPSKAFQLLYDIYHMERMNDDTATIIPPNLSHIAHLHVAAAPKRDCPATGGQIKYEKIVPAVVQAGYAGYWGLEFSPTGDPLAEVKRAKDYMESIVATVPTGSRNP